MTRASSLRFRQIHLDFHTGPWIHDVGRDFDPRAFARTMKQAQVDSVTVFAKCHHGHLYYDTKRPERHPGLRRGLNLLGEQIEALHRENIRAPIYISILCDEYAADHFPQWIAREPDGKPVGGGPLDAEWQILDMSSPYQDYLAEQTAEVLKLFKPVDGIFFDMCWDQPSLNNYSVQAMLEEGLDPQSPQDQQRFSHQVSMAYMKRLADMVKASSRSASLFFNGRGVWNLAEEGQFFTQFEIEALPTGGWGYMFFPTNVRFARGFRKPYLGMTARFHKSWADFGGLKPYAALEYETAQMMAHGARCSIGDQLHPRGTLDRAAYELIGKIYQRVEEREPWLRDAVPLTQIGVVNALPLGSEPQRGSMGSNEGAVRLLTQLRHQFDIIQPDANLQRYELIVLPDQVRVNEELARSLADYLHHGGSVLATGTSGVSEDATEGLLPQLGIGARGFSPFTTTYIRFGREISRDVPASDHVMYERGVRVIPVKGEAPVARVVEPYFERNWEHFCSHFQTPPARLTRYAAAVIHGSAGYMAYPIFSAFARHGNFPYRLLVRNILDRLLKEPLLRVDGPTGLESTVMRQDQRTIVQLIYYTPERRTEKLDLIEDIIPLRDLTISLKMSRAPKRVYLAPEKSPLTFEYSGGRAQVQLPAMAGHAMVVFE